MLDHSGSIEPQLRKIKQRSNYLRAHMKYYVQQLSVANQFLVWSVYIRPYFVYTAPVIHTQT